MNNQQSSLELGGALETPRTLRQVELAAAELLVDQALAGAVEVTAIKPASVVVAEAVARL